ncbi:hypothetical protein F5Y18DRAFT_440339 [Xylariaceae sp. FL1019]|nr:hypothetical protein F5Y18DRAFT_440339 [Xylariaceae sp. FL1019]
MHKPSIPLKNHTSSLIGSLFSEVSKTGYTCRKWKPSVEICWPCTCVRFRIAKASEDAILDKGVASKRMRTLASRDGQLVPKREFEQFRSKVFRTNADGKAHGLHSMEGTHHSLPGCVTSSSVSHATATPPDSGESKADAALVPRSLVIQRFTRHEDHKTAWTALHITSETTTSQSAWSPWLCKLPLLGTPLLLISKVAKESELPLSRESPNVVADALIISSHYQDPDHCNTMTSTDHEKAKAHLHSHGWCRILSVLTPSEASTVLDILWEAAKTNESRGEATHLPFLDPNSSNARVLYLLELHEKFRDLILHSTAIEFVQPVLGPDHIISNFTANIARPGSGSMALHSDQSIVFPEPWHDISALNIVWCLTDVRQKNGATMYIPGSNRWTTRSEIPPDAPSRLKSFEAKAGDCLVIDGRLWHTSGKNTTEDEDRALLFAYYTKPFVRQQVNWSAKLDSELRESLSEKLKMRLGLGPQGNICVVGDFRYLDVQFPGKDEDRGEGGMNCA